MDTSSRRQMEMALQASEEKFCSVFKHAGVGKALFSLKGRPVQVNEAFCEMLGYTEEELLGKDVWSITHPEESLDYLKPVLSGEIPYAQIEKRYLHKDGRTVWGLLTVALIRSSQAEPLYVLAEVHDITERKKNEAALNESREQYRLLVENSPAFIYIQTDGIVKYANPSGAKLLGTKTHEEIIGRSVLSFIHPDSVALVKARMHINQVERKPVAPADLKIVRDNGEVLDVETVAIPFIYKGKPAVQVIVRDISYRKQMEKEMNRLERLNLIGEMAAGIGHEIRNPLTTVRGFLQMLGDKNENAEFRAKFDLMIEELDRANAIITEYLSVSKNNVLELKYNNLNSIINAIYPLIQADALNFDKYVKLELGSIPDLLLDEKEIRQLLLNISRNGIEALPAGGKLTIATSAEANQVVLAIKDHGPGIDARIIDKLGTPFITTKDQGTGLGLAICYSIAERHGAKIDFDTGPEGTTFYVRLNVLRS